MRIAIVSHNFDKGGGQARVNYEIALRCLRAGASVHVVSERIAPELLDEGAQWRQIVPKLAKPQMVSNLSFANQADRVLARLRPDVDVIVGNGFVTRFPHDVSICHMLHSAL